MKEKELTDDYIQEHWLGKKDVTLELGKSFAAITRLSKQGKLRHKIINGLNYYDPESVTEVKLDPEVQLGTNGETSELMAMARAVLELVKGPRTDIDALQFKMLEYQAAQIEKLTSENEKLRGEINQARDTNVERDMAVFMAKSDSEVKKIAGIRMVETISKLVTGIGKKSGVELTPEQLEALVVMSEDGEEAFLSQEQAAVARMIIKEANQKIASGKAAAAQVAQQANGGAKSWTKGECIQVVSAWGDAHTVAEWITAWEFIANDAGVIAAGLKMLSPSQSIAGKAAAAQVAQQANGGAKS